MFPMIVVVDENCNGFFTPDGINLIPLPCQPGIDPISGLGPVPCYVLPQPVVAGDVLAVDPETLTVQDLLRFPDDGTGLSKVVYFLSDMDDPLDQDLADVGIPDFFQSNTAMVMELAKEGGFQYFVQVSDPGTYIGISDRGRQPATSSSGRRPADLSRSEEEILDLLERLPYLSEGAGSLGLLIREEANDSPNP
jgi:hypothetical protein